jgi:hypothetical protein
MRFSKSAIVLCSLAALLSACSPRFGHQPDDPTYVPFRGPVLVDDRYESPAVTRVPASLPRGVYNPASRFHQTTDVMTPTRREQMRLDEQQRMMMGGNGNEQP